MSKLYVFAIGGSGSRVLKSFTMMMAAGVKLGANEVVPIIIDPDYTNGDLSLTVSLMDEYRDIRKKLTFPAENRNNFFKTEISPQTQNYSILIQDTQQKSFREFIGLDSMDKENKAMAEMLFSEKNLNSNMNVGFKGNPNIGSVVLNQIVNTNDFQSFANSFADGDKIFIISSIFGGTGASGFPLLLKTLRTPNIFPNHNLINKAEIGAITILPYFMLKNDDQSEIDSSTFISKTKSALAYYENNEGGYLQKNNAHLIEFLSATAIFDFCNNSYLGNTTNKELGLNDLDNTVSYQSLPNVVSSLIMKPLTQFILMANAFTFKRDYYTSKDLAANAKSIGTDVYSSPFCNKLFSFFENYRIWLKQMKENKRSLDLFNLECGNKPFEVITGVIAKKIFSRLSDYDLFSDRLNGAINECTSNKSEDKVLEMYNIATDKLIKEKFNF